MNSQDETNCSTELCETAPAEGGARTRKPRYRVEKAADAYVVEVALPGAAKGAIGIAVEKGVLTVSADRATAEPETWNALHREIEPGGYHLALRLNAPIDESGIAASSEDGVLTLTLPVKEEAKPKAIEVK